MRIAIGSDHHGLDRKGTLIVALEAGGHMGLGLGAFSAEPVDYPGPEYLHATDQLHKGGRNNGLFIQITGEDKDDLSIPGVAHGLSTLKAAQAQSDLETLHACGRRVIRFRLAGNPAQGLQDLLQITRTAMRRL